MTSFYGIKARSQVDAFSFASANCKLREMKLLLDDGVDIDGVASDGFTAIASACRLRLIRSVELLLEYGADADLPSWQNMTPLMFACTAGKVKGSQIALRLIEHGVDVSYIRESDEMTALKFAVKDATPDVVQALIDNGADVDGLSGTVLTALMIAARANNVSTLEVLLKNGADPNRRCGLKWADGRNALGLAELEKQLKAAKYLRTVTPLAPN